MIGKPDDYYPHKQSNDPNAHSTGGYVEERLSKLEHEQRDLNEFKINVSVGYCLCCNIPMQLAFPMCPECLKTLGQITIAKRDGKFLF